MSEWTEYLSSRAEELLSVEQFMGIKPCQIGLKCPHLWLGEDGCVICMHPYVNGDAPADEEFSELWDTDCPIVKLDSRLYVFLDALSNEMNEVERFLTIMEKRRKRELRRYPSGVEERRLERALDGYWRMMDDETDMD